MAHVVWKPVVGQVVYKAYSTVQVGRIVAIVSRADQKKSFFDCVEVVWLKDGKKATTTTAGLQDFEKLVEETERKATKHRETLNRVLAEITY